MQMFKINSYKSFFASFFDISECSPLLLPQVLRFGFAVEVLCLLDSQGFLVCILHNSVLRGQNVAHLPGIKPVLSLQIDIEIVACFHLAKKFKVYALLRFFGRSMFEAHYVVRKLSVLSLFDECQLSLQMQVYPLVLCIDELAEPVGRLFVGIFRTLPQLKLLLGWLHKDKAALFKVIALFMLYFLAIGGVGLVSGIAVGIIHKSLSLESSFIFAFPLSFQLGGSGLPGVRVAVLVVGVGIFVQKFEPLGFLLFAVDVCPHAVEGRFLQSLGFTAFKVAIVEVIAVVKSIYLFVVNRNSWCGIISSLVTTALELCSSGLAHRTDGFQRFSVGYTDGVEVKGIGLIFIHFIITFIIPDESQVEWLICKCAFALLSTFVRKMSAVHRDGQSNS